MNIFGGIKKSEIHFGETNRSAKSSIVGAMLGIFFQSYERQSDRRPITIIKSEGKFNTHPSSKATSSEHSLAKSTTIEKPTRRQLLGDKLRTQYQRVDRKEKRGGNA